MAFRAVNPGIALPPADLGIVTRQVLVEWCAAENDYNQLHYDERAAKAAGFSRPPIQGTLRYALMGQLVQRWIGDRGEIERITADYVGLAIEGESMRACGEIVASDVTGEYRRFQLRLWVENDAGDVSTRGTATVHLHRAATDP